MRKMGLDEMDDATRETTEEIVVPLKLFDAKEISFTFPDSMASAEIAAERNPEHYEPEYHGKVFILREIEAIVEKRGMPGDQWKSRLHHHRPHYIEAQIWNHSELDNYYRSLHTSV